MMEADGSWCQDLNEWEPWERPRPPLRNLWDRLCSADSNGPEVRGVITERTWVRFCLEKDLWRLFLWLRIGSLQGALVWAVTGKRLFCDASYNVVTTVCGAQSVPWFTEVEDVGSHVLQMVKQPSLSQVVRVGPGSVQAVGRPANG